MEDMLNDDGPCACRWVLSLSLYGGSGAPPDAPRSSASRPRALTIPMASHMDVAPTPSCPAGASLQKIAPRAAQFA